MMLSVGEKSGAHSVSAEPWDQVRSRRQTRRPHFVTIVSASPQRWRCMVGVTELWRRVVQTTTTRNIFGIAPARDRFHSLAPSGPLLVVGHGACMSLSSSHSRICRQQCSLIDLRWRTESSHCADRYLAARRSCMSHWFRFLDSFLGGRSFEGEFVDSIHPATPTQTGLLNVVRRIP